MRRLILALAAMLGMTQAHAAQRSLVDAAVFFWDGGEANPYGYAIPNRWRHFVETEDPCIVEITEFIGPPPHIDIIHSNFRKFPGADAFTISESDPSDYRSFVLQAEARLPDGAVCELERVTGDDLSQRRSTLKDVPKGPCLTSWRIWDDRGEIFLRHRLRALDYIRNTFCQ
jgi:hypothetical protein